MTDDQRAIAALRQYAIRTAMQPIDRPGPSSPHPALRQAAGDAPGGKNGAAAAAPASSLYTGEKNSGGKNIAVLAILGVAIFYLCVFVVAVHFVAKFW